MFRIRPRRPTRRTLWRSLLRAGLSITALLLAALLSPLAAAAQEPARWTLPDALEYAFAHSPALRARQAEAQEIASHLVAARTYLYNPELSLEVADRSSPGSSATDRGLSLSQEIELAGQRRKRTAVAQEELTSAEAVLLRDHRRLAYQVETAFALAVRARELLGVARTDAALTREVLDYSQRRLERGATTQIEVNLAQASAGRAERAVQRTQAASFAARSRLAQLAGADPANPPEPLGDLDLPDEEPPPEAELLAQAFANRGDLLSAQSRELAAEAAIDLALAERRPNLIVGGFFQREESTDDIFGATVGISLPLFNRNQGAIAESRATRQRVRHEHEALRLVVKREVVTALNDLRAARQAAEFLRDQVVTTLEDNVDLLQRSFTAGRIGATEVVTLRREFVDSRREYIEALADSWLARIGLDLAIGGFTPSQPLSVKEQP